LLAVTLLGFGAGRAAAQTTYDACYVPAVGAIYLIRQAGLPTACLAQSHVAFSWTSGGTVADGSITIAKLAFDPATQTELDAVLAQLVAMGTINIPTNPVDWTQLKNVPAGLADGVDDGGGVSSDLVCTGCVGATDLANSAVTTPKIANGDVTEQKLSFNPTTQAELDSVTAALAAAGTINAATNPVDWTQLKNVPAGFADGTDAGGGVSDHGALAGLTDDDHAQYLLTDGVRNATNGFAVTGTFGTGTIPTTGNAVRLMWYPAKAAFRAGAPILGSWNDANIGIYSVAIGGGTSASGAYSVALGSAVFASGAHATALGRETQASGDSTTAIGIRTVASGVGATAVGYQTTASAERATALGSGTIANGVLATAMGALSEASGFVATAMGSATMASGAQATAMGAATTASGVTSTAMGSATTASGNFATAMGNSTVASGTHATALGGNTRANGNFTTVMGFETDAVAYGSLVIGRYNLVPNIIPPSPTSWVSGDPLFVAGNGSGAGPFPRTNALTLLKNGDLTIAGTLTQSSDLRYKEDIEPLGSALDGVLRLEPIHYRFREGTGHPTERRIGLGAQDVERLFPELVHRDSQGYLSVAYTDLTAVLVRAVQEQQELIAALRQRIEQLEQAAQRGAGAGTR
jgi:hypothetical protein